MRMRILERFVLFLFICFFIKFGVDLVFYRFFFKVEKIKIGHNGKGFGSGWFLDNVEIDLPSKGLRYLFTAHRWLDENEGKL